MRMERGWKIPTLAILLIIVGSFVILQHMPGDRSQMTGMVTLNIEQEIRTYADADNNKEIFSQTGNGPIFFEPSNGEAAWSTGYSSFDQLEFALYNIDPPLKFEMSKTVSLSNTQSNTKTETNQKLTPQVQTENGELPALKISDKLSYYLWISKYAQSDMRADGNNVYAYDISGNVISVYNTETQEETPYQLGIPPGPAGYPPFNGESGIADSSDNQNSDTKTTKQSATAQTTTPLYSPDPFKIPGSTGTITVTSSYSDNSRTAEIKIKSPQVGTDKTPSEQKITYDKDGNFFVGKNQYRLNKYCTVYGGKGPCLLPVKDGKEIYLDEKDYAEMKKINEYTGKKLDEACKTQPGGICPDTKKKNENYMVDLTQYTDSAISQVLTAYLDEVLGPFSNKWPYEAFCNDKIDKGDTDFSNRIHGIPVPQSDWQSQLEDDIYNNIRTAVVFGDVEEITGTIYRYDVTVKLVGDLGAPKWQVYLVNSCTGNDSLDFWEDHGALAFKQVFEMLYAGNSDEDMIFECGTDPQCRFDYVYLKFDDEANPRKFKLAGSDTIADLCG